MICTASYTAENSGRQISHTFRANNDQQAVAIARNEVFRLSRDFPAASGIRLDAVCEEDSPRRSIDIYAG